MKRSKLVAIDNLFFPFFWVINGLKNLFPGKSKTTDRTLILKFFGMGSITRIAAVIKNSENNRKYIFLTLERNKPIIEALNLKAVYIRDKNPFVLLISALSSVFKIWGMSSMAIADMERSSNLAGIYGISLSAGKKYARFQLAGADRKKGNTFSVSLENKSALSAIAQILSLESRPDLNEVTSSEIQSIILNVNAGGYLPERKFPLEKWAELTLGLHELFPKATFHFSGLKNEVDRVSKVVNELENKIPKDQLIDLSGKQNLTEFISTLKTCNLFLTNDSGPLHLAHYFNVKTVAIWGPTSPFLVGYPDSKQMLNLAHKLSCGPCFIHPKSKVAGDCNEQLTCFKEMETNRMLNQIQSFAG